MADYQSQAQFPSGTQQAHEANVLEVPSLVKFAIGLVALIILSAGCVRAVMWYFSREVTQLQALTPPRFKDESGLFPAPQLQANPDVELVILKKDELNRLNGYGWVDKNAAVAHIPIDRAIDILAKTGLPHIEAKPAETVAPSPPPTAPSAPSKKQDPKP